MVRENFIPPQSTSVSGEMPNHEKPLRKISFKHNSRFSPPVSLDMSTVERWQLSSVLFSRAMALTTEARNARRNCLD
ncbi:hypothetical protein E2C01_058949 [Portunus trituberculatus]|uniref:Uncharacterized protein n=1 Tax=Portunus trituberculatus TaxID=210409 RepID=A0A5B7H716_PORTR|nr:hypothetical protein [Portunus trituberculatus]